MPKFMILYRSQTAAADAMAQATPEEMQASMNEWIAWKDEVAKTFQFEFGLPLQLRHHFGVEAHETGVSGYSMIEGDDKDALHAAIEKHPHLKMPGASIDVFELLPIPGM